MTSTNQFKRGQRVLYRRSILCGRAPEFGIIVRPDNPLAKIGGEGWFIVRDEDRPDSRGICEHGEMLSDASDGWEARERDRLIAEADAAARRENESLSYRYQAEALRERAMALAA